MSTLKTGDAAFTNTVEYQTGSSYFLWQLVGTDTCGPGCGGTGTETQTWICENEFGAPAPGACDPSTPPTTTVTCTLPACPPVYGQCGTASNPSVGVTSAPTTNLCLTGTPSVTPSGAGPWTWVCDGNPPLGSNSPTCEAYVMVNGVCGSTGPYGSAPSAASQCVSGTPTSPVLNGASTGWTWICDGLYGGTNSGTCTAGLTPIIAVCGTANGTTVASATSGANPVLCNPGTPTAVTGTGPWTWGCNGNATGSNSGPCSANLTAINGVCGTANNVAEPATTPPPVGPLTLCSASTTAPVVSGTGPWTWSCTGNGTGTTAACGAPLGVLPVNGVCGAASGTTVAVAPSGASLCTTGTGTAATDTSGVGNGNGPWTWGCTGNSGGTSTAANACTAILRSLLRGNDGEDALLRFVIISHSKCHHVFQREFGHTVSL